MMNMKLYTDLQHYMFRCTVERRLFALIGTEGGANNRFMRIIKQP